MLQIFRKKGSKFIGIVRAVTHVACRYASSGNEQDFQISVKEFFAKPKGRFSLLTGRNIKVVTVRRLRDEVVFVSCPSVFDNTRTRVIETGHLYYETYRLYVDYKPHSRNKHFYNTLSTHSGNLEVGAATIPRAI